MRVVIRAIFATYYAIDTINFDPVDLSSARDTLEAPYLPLVIQEAAGLPLDVTFAEQKRILQGCDGAFYGCSDGAEARRFNRLLIDAGADQGAVSSANALRRPAASLQSPTIERAVTACIAVPAG